MASDAAQLELAIEKLKQEGSVAEAIEQAERALEKLSGKQGDRLRDLLVGLKLAAKDLAGATEVAWQRFQVTPDGQRLTELRVCAERARVWKQYQPRVVRFVREPGRVRGFELLMELLAKAGAGKQAVEAIRGIDCEPAVRAKLASDLASEFPSEAAELLFELAANVTVMKPGAKRYAWAVRQLREARELLRRADRLERFEEMVAAIRKQHASKPLLLATLDAERW